MINDRWSTFGLRFKRPEYAYTPPKQAVQASALLIIGKVTSLLPELLFSNPSYTLLINIKSYSLVICFYNGGFLKNHLLLKFLMINTYY